MKKLHLLKTMLLLCALIVGSSSVWAQEDYSATYESNVTLSTNVGANASEATVAITSGGKKYDAIKAGTSKKTGAVQITVPAGTKYLHIHAAGWNGETVTLSITPNSNVTPKSISLTSDSGISGNGPDFTLNASSKATTDYYKVLTFTTALEENTDFTFTASGGKRFVIWGVKSEAESSSYSVTYNANGAESGTVPTDDNVYVKDATVTVKGNTGSLTKAHYTFGGWNTKADGSGTTYAGGETFTITANTTLYAKWNANPHDITVPAADKFGSYAASMTDDVPYGTEVTLTYTPASGYETYVATWSVNGVEISGNKFDMPDENVTITVAVANDPSITYDFSEIGGFGDWGTTYSYHSVTYTDAIVEFTLHDHQTSTITDIPVTKGNEVRLKLINPGETLKSAKFVCRQWASKAQTITLHYSTDGGKNFFTLSPSVTSTNFTIESNSLPIGTNAVMISFSSDNQVGIESAKIVINRVVPMTISAAGYATFSSDKEVGIPTGVTAYYAEVKDESTITLKKITSGIIAATEGVVIQGSTGTYYAPITETEADKIAGNLLHAQLTAGTPSEPEYFTLAAGPKFVKSSGGTLAAGKAYLVLPASPAHELSISFDGEEEMTTGIKAVDNSQLTIDNYYNLNGQRVAQPTKGLYIVNGKKVIMK